MDIITKKNSINFIPAEATHDSFSWYTKLVVAAVLLSLVSIITPHETFAVEAKNEPQPLVFEIGNHIPYLDELRAVAIETDYKKRHEAAVKKLKTQLKMNEALKNYLQERRSPLAEYSHIILQQNNWKKIIALSNAESTLCRHYIEATANCWGVGGSDLWDMGANLGEGVESMNHFLNVAPRLSPKKYSDMLFIEMNGLYKQPAADHWVYNNMVIWNELTALEKSILQ